MDFVVKTKVVIALVLADVEIDDFVVVVEFLKEVVFIVEKIAVDVVVGGTGNIYLSTSNL